MTVHWEFTISMHIPCSGKERDRDRERRAPKLNINCHQKNENDINLCRYEYKYIDIRMHLKYVLLFIVWCKYFTNCNTRK